MKIHISFSCGVGAYVVRTSSLNDNKHSCQLFRIAASSSSLVLLSSSVSGADPGFWDGGFFIVLHNLNLTTPI